MNNIPMLNEELLFIKDMFGNTNVFEGGMPTDTNVGIDDVIAVWTTSSETRNNDSAGNMLRVTIRLYLWNPSEDNLFDLMLNGWNQEREQELDENFVGSSAWRKDIDVLL